MHHHHHQRSTSLTAKKGQDACASFKDFAMMPHDLVPVILPVSSTDSSPILPYSVLHHVVAARKPDDKKVQKPPTSTKVNISRSRLRLSSDLGHSPSPRAKDLVVHNSPRQASSFFRQLRPNFSALDSIISLTDEWPFET